MADENRNSNLMKNKDKEEKVERRGLFLPVKILNLVLSLLVVRDNIRASAVCKMWYKICAAIRRKDSHPWLMKCAFSPALRRPCELYDPVQQMTYFIEYPEVQDMKVLYAKEGWLLLGSNRSPKICFFNPFSRELISLPACEFANDSAAFTCPPTSNDCLVFGLSKIENNTVRIVGCNTLRIGDTQWETTTCHTCEYFFSYKNKIVFTGGRFYCLGGLGSGSLGEFDPTTRAWRTNRLKCGGNYILPIIINWNRTYMLEIQGDIMLVKLFDTDLRVFKLNRDGFWIWEEKERIEEGLTVFGGPHVTEYYVPDPESNMKQNNKILISDSCYKEVQSYGFEEGKYQLPTTSTRIWDTRNIVDSVWVKPPNRFLNFD